MPRRCAWRWRAALVLSLTATSTLGAAPATHTVAIDGFVFRPAVISVRVGDTITWRNADPVAHTVTEKTAGLDSGDIAAGGAFRFVAKRKGRYTYVCTLHPTMRGELVVE